MDKDCKNIWRHAMHMESLIDDIKRSAKAGDLTYIIHLAKRLGVATTWIQNIAEDAEKAKGGK